MNKKDFILDIGKMASVELNVEHFIKLSEIYDELKAKPVVKRVGSHKWTKEDEAILYSLQGTMPVKQIAREMDLSYRTVTNKLYQDKKYSKE